MRLVFAFFISNYTKQKNLICSFSKELNYLFFINKKLMQEYVVSQKKQCLWETYSAAYWVEVGQNEGHKAEFNTWMGLTCQYCMICYIYLENKTQLLVWLIQNFDNSSRIFILYEIDRYYSNLFLEKTMFLKVWIMPI